MAKKPPKLPPSVGSSSTSSSRRTKSRGSATVKEISNAHELTVDKEDNRQKIIIIAIILAILILLLLLMLVLIGGVLIAGAGIGGGRGDGKASLGDGNSSVISEAQSDGQSTSNIKAEPVQTASTPAPPATQPLPPETTSGSAEAGDQSGGGTEAAKKPPAVGNTDSGSTADNQAAGVRTFYVPSSSFFGIGADGTQFVYIIDCSGSMAGPAFERAKTELLRSIDALQDDQSFFVYFFADFSYPMFHPQHEPALIPATVENKQKVNTWVQNFDVQGGTEPEAALMSALNMNPEIVYLLTDGGFDSSIVDRTTQKNGGKSVINTIGFIDRSGEQVLKSMASKNRGDYRFVQ